MSIEEEPEKKQKGTFKIMGFNIPKKPFIIVISIVILLIIGNIIKNKNDDAKWAAEQAEKLKENSYVATTPNVEVPDYDEVMQKNLRQKYGIPPEGFKWSVLGELVALGSDPDKNPEDVVYTYVRALSMLDFATAQKYSKDSNVYKTYTERYSAITTKITDYYNEFLRKQYKLALTTIELKGVEDVAVFADGTEYVTITVSALDLQDKDFWQKDKDYLYNQMRVYEETETDAVKKEQFVYNYIYDAYEQGKVGKRDYTIEFVVTKGNDLGWLVTNDAALDHILDYTNGVNVAEYILHGYSNWLREVRLQESMSKYSN